MAIIMEGTWDSFLEVGDQQAAWEFRTWEAGFRARSSTRRQSPRHPEASTSTETAGQAENKTGTTLEGIHLVPASPQRPAGSTRAQSSHAAELRANMPCVAGVFKSDGWIVACAVSLPLIGHSLGCSSGYSWASRCMQ